MAATGNVGDMNCVTKRVMIQDSEEENSWGSAGEEEKTPSKSGRSQHGSSCELERMRREVRLAMNRQSARVRRKKKKELLSTLEKRAELLEKQNTALELSNEKLKKEARSLEAELAVAKSTIVRLTQNQSEPMTAAAGSPQLGVMDDTKLASVILEQKAAELQQQAALLKSLPGAAADSMVQRHLSAPGSARATTDGSLAQLQVPLSGVSGLFGNGEFSLNDKKSVMNYISLASLANQKGVIRNPHGLLAEKNLAKYL